MSSSGQLDHIASDSVTSDYATILRHTTRDQSPLLDQKGKDITAQVAERVTALIDQQEYLHNHAIDEVPEDLSNEATPLLSGNQGNEEGTAMDRGDGSTLCVLWEEMTILTKYTLPGTLECFH
jgi:hypothetical protein